VREAERIGMTREEILEYLKIGDSPPKIWRNFVKAMKLKNKGSKPAKKVTRFPVKIKREAVSKLYPFTDYFKGFEKAEPVKEIFGYSTKGLLAGLKVEFIDSPFPTIFPSEEDGHLIVANDYFRKGTLHSIYLDAILSLNMIKQFMGSGVPTIFGEEFGKDPRVFQAYAAMVKEARRLNLDDAEILKRLQLLSFLLEAKDYSKFLKALGLKISN